VRAAESVRRLDSEISRTCPPHGPHMAPTLNDRPVDTPPSSPYNFSEFQNRINELSLSPFVIIGYEGP
jgi:hypothetical protein